VKIQGRYFFFKKIYIRSGMVFMWRTTLAIIRITVKVRSIPRSKTIGKLPVPVYENRAISVKYVR